MPGSKKNTYYLGGENFLIFDIYKTRDLLALSKEFKVNRSFESWADVFQKSLDRHKRDIYYKKRSKEQLARRFPRKIVDMFWELVCNDLIYNDAEVILKDSKIKENRFVLKLGYLESAPKYRFMKKTNFNFPYGGMHYTLRINYPANWENSDIPRRACFYQPYRTKIWQELKRGRRYHNSYKEKIFAKL